MLRMCVRVCVGTGMHLRVGARGCVWVSTKPVRRMYPSSRHTVQLLRHGPDLCDVGDGC